MAISVAPLTTSVMGSVDTQYVGTASGVNNAVSRTAGLLAIAVLGIVIVAVFCSSLLSHLALLQIPVETHNNIVAQQIKLVGIDIPTGLSSSTHAAIQQAISESFVAGFRVVMLIASGLALVSSLCSFLLIEGKKSQNETKAA